jgi:hypothetical protein
MSHFWVLPLIATVVMGAIAAVAVILVRNWISKSRRTFEIRAKDGRKVVFEVEENEDLSSVVATQLRRLEQQGERQRAY